MGGFCRTVCHFFTFYLSLLSLTLFYRDGSTCVRSEVRRRCDAWALTNATCEGRRSGGSQRVGAVALDVSASKWEFAAEWG